MKTKAIIAAMLAAAVSAAAVSAKEVKDPSQNLYYTLPQTTFTINVSANHIQVVAGKYAAYAREFLGIDVPKQDDSKTEIISVRLSNHTEADLSRWFKVPVTGPDNKAVNAIAVLTKQGLISGIGTNSKGVANASVFQPGATYNKVQAKTSGSKKSAADKALRAEADSIASVIMKIREARYAIIVGDTDATYSGEALGAATKNLQDMEKALLKEFIGTTDTTKVSAQFNVVPAPNAKKQRISAFKVSGPAGLVPSSASDGTEYFVDIDRPDVAQIDVEDPDAPAVVYRVPAVCTVTITDGTRTLLQTRQPVYQLGAQVRYPVFN